MKDEYDFSHATRGKFFRGDQLTAVIRLWRRGEARRLDVVRAVEAAIVEDADRDVLEELPEELRQPIWTVLRLTFGHEAGDEEPVPELAVIVPRLRAWVRSRQAQK